MQNSRIESSAATLIEDLKNQETKTKINAIKSLSTIALTIGKERTRNELLPYLADTIDEEDDESLIELAKVLSAFLDYVGGKLHASCLFKFLENLITSDDYPVRTEGLISFKFILSQVNPADYEVQLMELIRKLSKGEYVYYKLSAINLISTVYPYFNPENKKVLKS